MDHKAAYQRRKSKPGYIEKERKRYRDNYAQFYHINRKCILKRKYGITWDEYQEMFESQKGLCAICQGVEEGRMLSVDHDHETGKVRGLLCGSCNRALGLFKEDPELLDIAKEYV